MKEEWRTVIGYESIYEVSNKGRIKSLKRLDFLGRKRKQRILKIRFHHRYNYTSSSILLHKNGKAKETQVSRLVAQAFIPNLLNKPFINHIDNNATNNIVNNLEWCTREENVEHAVKQGRFSSKRKKSFPQKLLD